MSGSPRQAGEEIAPTFQIDESATGSVHRPDDRGRGSIARRAKLKRDIVALASRR
jgi:hypothetical protein